MNLFNAIILALLSFCYFSESVLAGNTDTVKTIQKSVSLKHLSNNVIKKFYGHWLSDDYQAKFYLSHKEVKVDSYNGAFRPPLSRRLKLYE